jgi:methylphosphotriester-DNA--protein-cysteine methyltransferase
MMLYQEYPPHPALAAHVVCLWTAAMRPAPGAPAHTHRVLPDNCVDILWQDGGGAGVAVGMMSRAIQVASGAPVRIAAVRFRPGAAGPFLGLPLHALSDQRAGMDDLWGRSEAERLGDSLWERELDDQARLALIEQALLARLQAACAGGGHGSRSGAGGAHGSGAVLVARALAAIDASGGRLPVAGLAGSLGASRQHIAAQFRTHVGLTPKLYARIVRFRRAAEALKAARTPDWAALALECGYFDQSHLIHDFQEFSGSSPAAFQP